MTVGAALAVLWMVFSSCERSDDNTGFEIDGTYIGSLSTSVSLTAGPEMDQATAVVSMVGDQQIDVHCIGVEFDTTLVLDYYPHNDSVMVCLTGDDFYHMYGHRLGQGHMSGGMMGDKSEGESDWMHHLDDEHSAGDEHFGGFDLSERSFTYSFKMMEGNTPYYVKFYGVKE